MDPVISHVFFEEDGATAECELLKLSDNIYRVEQVVPFIELVSYHDTIETTTSVDGSLIFRRVVKKSDYTKYDYAVSKKVAESAELRAVLDRVTQLGGYWERMFGGLLFVFLPS